MNTDDLRVCIASASQELFARKEEINRLNVFPVPDGDTGTNMSLTMESVVREISALPADADINALRKAITHGSLMGARGNSGVITSQILRGLCEGFAGVDTIDTQAVAHAASRAVEVAFQAVRKPVKGTILTVLEDCANVAKQAADGGLDLNAALHLISDEALASVKRTPEFLPVLKENGVVDSGGFGLTILIQSFIAALSGEQAHLASSEDFTHAEAKVAIEHVRDWAGSDFMYCTEFLLHSDSVDVPEALEFLSSMGDCELLVGSHPDFKVHVHTDTPGTVLTYMTDRGQVSEVFIHNMVLESEQRADGIAAEEAKAETEGSKERKKIAFIAVAAGEGMANILRSLGVDHVVSGGQTMNPSTKDLLDAIEIVNADSVVLLPNNKNIIMAANAAAENADVVCKVVPTTSVPASFSAMLATDLGEDAEVNAQLMTEALEDVHCGEITKAIKESKTSSGEKIAPGDYIGIADGSLDVVGTDMEQVALSLIEELDDDSDSLTMLAGQDYAQEDFESLMERIEEEFPDLEIDAQRGDQPLYPLVFSIE